MSDPGTPHIVLTKSGPPVPWVGQMVRIDVALYRPHTSAGELSPFSFEELDVPGAIAIFRSEAPPPSELEEAGVSYLVQHRSLLVFPQQDGELVVPPVYARFDDPITHAPVRVASAPLSIKAALPRAASDEELPLVARALTLKSTLDRKLEGLSVGDGFTHTVVLSAQDTDPVMLPALSFADVPGLRLYPAEPRAQSSAERGVIRASRSYSATYVVERVGHYELPQLSVRWLDPASGRYATAHVSVETFWARPNFGLGLSAFGSAPGLGLALSLSALLLLAALIYVTRVRLREGPFAWEERLYARYREQRAFLAFERALAHGAPLVLLRRAYAWLALRLPHAERTLAPLREASTQSAETLQHWEEQAFSGGANGRAERHLHRTFARARRVLDKPRAESAVSAINPHTDSRKDRSWTTRS